MNLIIMGPQGSGKGTQAKKLAERYHLIHISTGDLFRENIKKKTLLGKKVEALINQGKYIDDETTFAVLKHRIQKEDVKNGFILDGYPRNVHQAELLKVSIDAVLEIHISDEAAVARLGERQYCPSCGRTYNPVTISPKISGFCDVCKLLLTQRKDDTPERVKIRLMQHHQETDPLKTYYQSKLIIINGEQAVEKVFHDIIKALAEKKVN